jgi:hypothetical protein
MNRISKWLLGAALAIAALNVNAQNMDDNAKFLADQLVGAQFDQSMQGMKKQMPALMSRMAQQMQSQFPGGADGKARFNEMMEKMAPLQEKLMSAMADAFKAPDVRAELSAAALASIRRVYLPAEIDSLAAYYRTPIGAAVAFKQAAVAVDMMPAIGEVTGRVMQPAMKDFMDSMKVVAAEHTEKVKKAE